MAALRCCYRHAVSVCKYLLQIGGLLCSWCIDCSSDCDYQQISIAVMDLDVPLWQTVNFPFRVDGPIGVPKVKIV